MEVWKQYFEAFAERESRIPSDASDRRPLLYEAAHDAYQETSDALTGSGWDEERVLVLGRMFGTVVKDWVDSGGESRDALRRELEIHYSEWARD